VGSVLRLALVEHGLRALNRHRARHLAQLWPYFLGDRRDTVAVQLFEAPQQAVGGLEHAVKGIAAPVLPAHRGFLLLDPAARVIDHVELPFLAYPLRDAA